MGSEGGVIPNLRCRETCEHNLFFGGYKQFSRAGEGDEIGAGIVGVMEQMGRGVCFLFLLFSFFFVFF